MEDYINEDEIAAQNKSDLHVVPMRMCVAALIMMPMAFYFFYDRVALFGYAFYFGALILSIFGIGMVKSAQNENPVINATQLRKLKLAKVLCIVALIINVSIILLYIILLSILNR